LERAGHGDFRIVKIKKTSSSTNQRSFIGERRNSKKGNEGVRKSSG